MKLETRTVVAYGVRAALLFFAGWVALHPDALPGSHTVTRVGLAAGFLVLSIMVSETIRLNAQFEILLKALRTVGARGSDGAMRVEEEPAIGILIRALTSRDAGTREKAHRNLVRLTGQDLPPDRGAWEAWWASQAKTEGKAGGS